MAGSLNCTSCGRPHGRDRGKAYDVCIECEAKGERAPRGPFPTTALPDPIQTARKAVAR